jgi:hypothetical protein
MNEFQLILLILENLNGRLSQLEQGEAPPDAYWEYQALTRRLEKITPGGPPPK